MAETTISNQVLVQEIISTGKKVSSIEAKIDGFLVEQASLKRDVKSIREDVDGLITARKGDRKFISGVALIGSPLLAAAGAWFSKTYLGF